eukprot:4652359-Amphidinium_carterae.1
MGELSTWDSNFAQLATLVKTHNKTVDEDAAARNRIEWFITFSSATIPEVQSQGPPRTTQTPKKLT